MNKMMQAAVAATLVLGAAGSARADLTVSGEVGLPLNPTAQIPAPGGIRLQGTYVNVDGTFYGLHAAGRIGDSPLEINGGFERVKNGDSDNGFSIGAKYLITRETDPIGVRIAAGVGFSDALADNIRAYVVGTRAFGNPAAGRPPITGHLGARLDRYDDNIGGGDDTRFSIFTGVEVPITVTGDFSFVGELGTKVVDDGGTRYSAGVRYRPAGRPFGATVGFMRPFGDTGFFAQIGYTFGGGGGAAAGTADAGDFGG